MNGFVAISMGSACSTKEEPLKTSAPDPNVMDNVRIYGEGVNDTNMLECLNETCCYVVKRLALNYNLKRYLT